MADNQIYIDWLDVDKIQFAIQNPKLHAVGDIAASEQRYGVIETPILDESTGRLVAGHGRIESLRALRKQWLRDKKTIVPKNVKIEGDTWLVPITRGNTFESPDEATAYQIDSNNLVMSGGDFTAFDISRVWTDGYTDILRGLAENGIFPVSVDADALDDLIKAQVEDAMGKGAAMDKDGGVFTIILDGLSEDDKTEVLDMLNAAGYTPVVKASKF